MKKGWFKKAKIKFINERVYEFELSRTDYVCGSDKFKERYDENPITTYYGSKANWQYDIVKIGGFAQRFIWASELGKQKSFYFSYVLKKDLKY